MLMIKLKNKHICWNVFQVYWIMCVFCILSQFYWHVHPNMYYYEHCNVLKRCVAFCLWINIEIQQKFTHEQGVKVHLVLMNRIWHEVGNAWKGMEMHGKAWKSMEKHGKAWKSMEGHGRARGLVSICSAALLVDRPTQLICISDIYVNRQIQKT